MSYQDLVLRVTFCRCDKFKVNHLCQSTGHQHLHASQSYVGAGGIETSYSHTTARCTSLSLGTLSTNLPKNKKVHILL